ncbi:MAG TPA: type II toxin-antitoxin system prevent-host-death family antitoxin [Promineifilum sp.]
MTQVIVGIRELKARLSEYLRQVKAGETVIITEHGRPIGRIVPEPESLEQRIQRLVESGELVWSGKKLLPFEPVGENAGDIQLSDLVSELRE